MLEMDFGLNVTFVWPVGFLFPQDPAQKRNESWYYYLMGWKGVQLWLEKAKTVCFVCVCVCCVCV